MNKTIKCRTKGEMINSHARSIINDFIKDLKEDEFYIQLLTKKEHEKKHRSSIQNRKYYGEILPAMVYYCDWLNMFGNPKAEQKSIHYMIKLQYCYFERNDLIVIHKIRLPKTGEIVERAVPFEWKFSQTSQKEANAFLNWCIKQVEQASHSNYDDAVFHLMEEGIIKK